MWFLLLKRLWEYLAESCEETRSFHCSSCIIRSSTAARPAVPFRRVFWCRIFFSSLSTLLAIRPWDTIYHQQNLACIGLTPAVFVETAEVNNCDTVSEPFRGPIRTVLRAKFKSQLYAFQFLQNQLNWLS